MRFWHLASLDAPTVAVVWTIAFAWAAGAHLLFKAPLLLALAAWVVYVGDRLLDARTALRSEETSKMRHRHRFHWRHRRIFISLAVLAAASAVWIFLVLVPPFLRQRDSALAALALVYFTSVHSSRKLASWSPMLLAPPLPSILSSFPAKELLVGLLFTTACALPSLSRLPASTPAALLLVPMAFFASLAWLNCHAIESWESTTVEPHFFTRDSGRAATFAEPHRGLAPVANRIQSARTNPIFPVAGLLAVAGLFLACVGFPLHPRPAALLTAGATSALLLALLDRYRNRLSPLALRVAADLALLTPALLAPLARIFR